MELWNEVFETEKGIKCDNKGKESETILWLEVSTTNGIKQIAKAESGKFGSGEVGLWHLDEFGLWESKERVKTAQGIEKYESTNDRGNWGTSGAQDS